MPPIRLGSAYHDQDLVFCEPTGAAMDPDRLTRAFRSIARRARHPNVRLHDLRHFHASALIKVGTRMKVVQERLGHASAAFTLQVYGH